MSFYFFTQSPVQIHAFSPNDRRNSKTPFRKYAAHFPSKYCVHDLLLVLKNTTTWSPEDYCASHCPREIRFSKDLCASGSEDAYTEHRKNRRMRISLERLNRVRNDENSLERLITGDETWARYSILRCKLRLDDLRASRTATMWKNTKTCLIRFKAINAIVVIRYVTLFTGRPSWRIKDECRMWSVRFKRVDRLTDRAGKLYENTTGS